MKSFTRVLKKQITAVLLTLSVCMTSSCVPVLIKAAEPTVFGEDVLDTVSDGDSSASEQEYMYTDTTTAEREHISAKRFLNELQPMKQMEVFRCLTVFVPVVLPLPLWVP